MRLVYEQEIRVPSMRGEVLRVLVGARVPAGEGRGVRCSVICYWWELGFRA